MNKSDWQWKGNPACHSNLPIPMPGLSIPHIQYVEPEGYQIARAGKMNVPEGLLSCSRMKENPLRSAGEQEGRKIALFAFSSMSPTCP